MVSRITPLRLTRTDRPTSSRSAGRLVVTRGLVLTGTRPRRRAARPSAPSWSGSTPSTRRLAIVGTPRQNSWSRVDRPPSPTRSASRITIGPRVVNVPPAVIPVVWSSSPSHAASVGSTAQIPLIVMSIFRVGSRRLTTDRRSPTARPSSRAAASETVAWTGSLPAVGHAPATSVARPSRPSTLWRIVRSVTLAAGMDASANEPERAIRTISPPVGAIAAASSGRMTASSPSMSPGLLVRATSSARVDGGAASSARWRPPLATASPYTTPVARSVVALTSRSQAASTTGQSARLRCTTAPGRPVRMGTPATFSRSRQTLISLVHRRERRGFTRIGQPRSGYRRRRRALPPAELRERDRTPRTSERPASGKGRSSRSQPSMWLAPERHLSVGRPSRRRRCRRRRSRASSRRPRSCGPPSPWRPARRSRSG